MHTCPECGNKNITCHHGEIICRECGLVIEDSGIEQPFISEAIQSQATHPHLTTAGTKGINGKIYKTTWMLSTREKNLQTALNKIEIITARLNIPNQTTKEAKLLFKESQYANIGVGRDNISVIYASVYIACNIQGIPKTPLELTAYTEINETQLMRTYKLIKKKLEITTKPIDPLDILPRFASKLELSPNTIATATEILIKAKETGIGTGKKPETLLAGAIYLACQQTGEERTQRQIANTIGVIEVSIRKISKDLFKNNKFL
jgi:transcription initiation factor TFIIB